MEVGHGCPVTVSLEGSGVLYAMNVVVNMLNCTVINFSLYYNGLQCYLKNMIRKLHDFLKKNVLEMWKR